MPPVIRGLRQYRRLAELSQTDLARMVGVSKQTILNLERNGRTPTLPLARKLARILDAPLDALFPPSGSEGAAA